MTVLLLSWHVVQSSLWTLLLFYLLTLLNKGTLNVTVNTTSHDDYSLWLLSPLFLQCKFCWGSPCLVSLVVKLNDHPEFPPTLTSNSGVYKKLNLNNHPSVLINHTLFSSYGATSPVFRTVCGSWPRGSGAAVPLWPTSDLLLSASDSASLGTNTPQRPTPQTASRHPF